MRHACRLHAPCQRPVYSRAGANGKRHGVIAARKPLALPSTRAPGRMAPGPDRAACGRRPRRKTSASPNRPGSECPRDGVVLRTRRAGRRLRRGDNAVGAAMAAIAGIFHRHRTRRRMPASRPRGSRASANGRTCLIANHGLRPETETGRGIRCVTRMLHLIRHGSALTRARWFAGADALLCSTVTNAPARSTK